MSEMDVKIHGPKVFVYGTLKRGHGNHRLLRGGKQLGRCYVEGPWRMKNLGYFPGVVQAKDAAGPAKMFGEVYLIDTDTLAGLDLLEGYPNFYTRTKVATPWGNAWMYYLNPDSHYYESDSALPELELGCWNPTAEERDWARSIINSGG